MRIDPPGLPNPMSDELNRLAALYGSGLLEDGPQETLDALVEAAAAMLDCPVAMLNLIDRDFLHVRAATNGPIEPVPRELSLCDYAIREPDGLVIPDLGADSRFSQSPLIDDGIRFYAGAPVLAPDPDGTLRPIGALCVTDEVPRHLDERGRATLRHLAHLADVLIAARADAKRAIGIAVEHERLVAELARQHHVFGRAERMAGLGSWRLSLIDGRLEWSEGVYRIYGLPDDTKPDLQVSLAGYPEEARARVAAALAGAVEGGAFDFEEDFHTVTGERRRIRCLGEREQVDGRDVAVVGVLHDVTDRHRLETALRHDADTDSLTGLANRAAFDKALAGAIARARTDGTALTLALIDLDGFKAVNDTLGHAAGDDVLRDVGAGLHALAIDATIMARIGGDEFALLVEGEDIEPVALCEMIEGALQVSVRVGDLTVACSGSVGTALLADETSPRDFLHRADIALYAAKRARIGDRRGTQRRRAA